jgi:hypothetical protein
LSFSKLLIPLANLMKHIENSENLLQNKLIKEISSIPNAFVDDPDLQEESFNVIKK